MVLGLVRIQTLLEEMLPGNLRRLGCHVTVEVLRPNEDWAELEDRRRWLLVGTLARPFTIQVPHEGCGTPASAFIDPRGGEVNGGPGAG